MTLTQDAHLPQERTGRIEGRLVDSDGKSVSGASVVLSETGETDVSRVGGADQGEAAVSATFGTGEMPEEISLDALLAGLASLSSRNGKLHVSDVTDRVFSALFYSRMWPFLAKTWPSGTAGDHLLWTIRNIPFRKFKSAIPVLLTASHPRSIAPALTAELMFALFYLVDDLIDGRTHRYGRKTALGASGPAQTASAIMVALTQIDEWLVSMQASNSVRRIVSEGAQALADEQNRRRGTGARSMEEYAEHSRRRTRFLGDLWTAACQESECETEASLVRHIYGTCALAGQIKNDLRDIRTADAEERFRDIKDGVRNSCILRLLQIAGAAECAWITRCLGRGRTLTADDETELVRLFSRHSVDTWASGEVRSLSQHILTAIDNAEMIDAKKWVLSEWVALQFTFGLDPDSGYSPTRVSRFLDAVSELTNRL